MFWKSWFFFQLLPLNGLEQFSHGFLQHLLGRLSPLWKHAKLHSFDKAKGSSQTVSRKAMKLYGRILTCFHFSASDSFTARITRTSFALQMLKSSNLDYRFPVFPITPQPTQALHLLGYTESKSGLTAALNDPQHLDFPDLRWWGRPGKLRRASKKKKSEHVGKFE